MTFEGKSIVVTGAASGIGRAIAQMAASQGGHVFIGDLDEKGGAATVEAIRTAGGRADYLKLDVSKGTSIDAFVANVTERVGVLDVLINAAGWDKVEPFLDSTPETWQRVIDINFTGPVRLCHGFLPGMLKRGGGKIVNIASDAGRVGSMGEVVYAGAKGGIISFTKSLAREAARGKVNVNCVCPGPTNTPMYHEQDPKLKEILVKVIPFRRVAEPSEIASATLFFAGSGSDYITGQVLSVSGGLTMAG